MLEIHPRRTGPVLSLKDSMVAVGGIPVGETRFRLGDKLAQRERGAIIADNWGVTGKGTNVDIQWLAPHYPTYALAFLFNDVVDLPIFADQLGAPPPVGIESLSRFRRSSMAVQENLQHRFLAALETQVYIALDEREPGAWALWHEPDYDPIPRNFQTPDMALRASLNSALLVPAPTVPYQDVVEFRDRNIKALRALRLHLDELAIKIANNGYNPAEVRLELEKLETSILEYNEEARKPNWKKAVASLEVSMNWGDLIRTSIAGLVAAGGGAAFHLQLPQMGVLVAGAALTTVGISSTRSIRGNKSASPFEYIAKIEREFD